MVNERRPASTMHEGDRVSWIQVKGKQTNKQRGFFLLLHLKIQPSGWPRAWTLECVLLFYGSYGILMPGPNE